MIGILHCRQPIQQPLAFALKDIDDDRRRLEKENKEYQNNLEKLVKERTKSLIESEAKIGIVTGADLFGSTLDDSDYVPVKIEFNTEDTTYCQTYRRDLGYYSFHDLVGQVVLQLQV